MRAAGAELVCGIVLQALHRAEGVQQHISVVALPALTHRCTQLRTYQSSRGSA